jgi:hypothetical protein
MLRGKEEHLSQYKQSREQLLRKVITAGTRYSARILLTILWM